MSSNVFLEHGIWTNYQIVAWALVGVSASLLRSQFLQDEKLNIASKYLLPKQMDRNGIKEKEGSLENGNANGLWLFWDEESKTASLQNPIPNPRMELWETTNSKGTKFNLVKSWE